MEDSGPGNWEAAALRAYWTESIQGRVGESDDNRVLVFSCSDPGKCVRMAATRRDGVSFYTLVFGEGSWDSCLPVTIRKEGTCPSSRPGGDRGKPAATGAVSRELCSQETPAFHQRQTWSKEGRIFLTQCHGSPGQWQGLGHWEEGCTRLHEDTSSHFCSG